MTIITLSEIKYFIDSNSHLDEKSEYKKLNLSIDELKYNAFKNLMKYYQFEGEIKLLNEELKELILLNEDLSQTSVRNWCNKTRKFFKENLFGFGLEYLDSDCGTGKENYVHIVSDFIIKKNDIFEIIKFWNLQWILYFSNYHIPEQEREDRLSGEPNGYYYLAVDPNVPSELDEIKRLLNL